MDEPTSAITDREVDSLFKMIEDLKAHGTGIIYISHKLDEILRISDEISVLRDGTNVSTWPAADVDNEMIIRSMVGREIREQFPKTEKRPSWIRSWRSKTSRAPGSTRTSALHCAGARSWALSAWWAPAARN